MLPSSPVRRVRCDGWPRRASARAARRAWSRGAAQASASQRADRLAYELHRVLGVGEAAAEALPDAGLECADLARAVHGLEHPRDDLALDGRLRPPTPSVRP